MNSSIPIQPNAHTTDDHVPSRYEWMLLILEQQITSSSCSEWHVGEVNSLQSLANKQWRRRSYEKMLSNMHAKCNGATVNMRLLATVAKNGRGVLPALCACAFRYLEHSCLISLSSWVNIKAASSTNKLGEKHYYEQRRETCTLWWQHFQISYFISATAKLFLTRFTNTLFTYQQNN